MDLLGVSSRSVLTVELLHEVGEGLSLDLTGNVLHDHYQRRRLLLAVCASATRLHITDSMPEASATIQALCKKKQLLGSLENLIAEWNGQIPKEKQDIAYQLQHMGEIFGGLQWY
jgi:hypothetical protein